MIPIFEPVIADADVAEVVAALRRGEISGSFGTALPGFEQAFADYVGVDHAVAVSSGTAALQLAVAAADLGPGAEILISSSTNIATALAVVHNGATPIPVDSEDVTWNLDLELLDKFITPATKAIIPVHLFGTPVDMDQLMEIADRRNLLVIEDCAEALGARVRGRMTGTFGTLACFSFYANKVITTGEGGMVVTTNEEYAERLRLLRNLAFSQPRFVHDQLGFNFRMTGMQAALGLSQLRRVDEVLVRKREVAQQYTRFLKDIPWLKLPIEPEWATSIWWMYAIELLPTAPVTRDRLMESLLRSGIETRTFFCPMNQQPALRALPGFDSSPCPIADRIWQSGLYLPSSPSLQNGEIEYVCAAVRNVA